jgi:hypothetical protein
VFKLDGVFQRGPRKGQAKRKLVSKRNGWRGRPRGKLATGARAVGAGEDPATSRDSDLLAWLSPIIQGSEDSGPPVLDLPRAQARAAIAAAVTSEHDLPGRVLAIARRAAARQARRIFDYRGVTPSRSSIDDAASDAVLGLLSSVRRLDKLTPAQWSTRRVLRVVGMYAGRAAFRSLASWAVVGMVGDNTTTRGDARQWVGELQNDLARAWGKLDSLPEDGADMANQRARLASLDASLPATSRAALALDMPAPPDYSAPDSITSARRAAVAWVYRVGYRQFKATLGKRGTGRAVQAALSRCRVVASVIMGASLTDACAATGFASFKVFAQSCKESGFAAALRDARARAAMDGSQVEQYRIAMRRYALEVAQHARALHACGGGWRDVLHTSTHRATTAHGLARGARVAHRRAIVRDYLRALGLAVHYRDAMRRAMSDDLRAFDRMLSGVFADRFGDLRLMLGFVDSEGRERGASKVNPAMLRRARGKLARKSGAVATVALPMGASGRGRPCAVAVGGAVTMDGPRGFVWVKRAAAR